jgi:protein O-GlcNAc transferase
MNQRGKAAGNQSCLSGPFPPGIDSGLPDGTESFSLGLQLLEAGEAAEAAKRLRLAVEASPDDPVILQELAKAYHRSGDYLPALRTYDRIIGLGAATAETWFAAGNALKEVGEYAQAIGAYENSLKLDGSNPEAHHNFAQVLYRLGDVDRAVGHLESAAEGSDAIASWVSLATAIPGAPGAGLQRIRDTRIRCADKLAGWAGVPEVEAVPASRVRPKGSGPLRVGYLSAFFHAENYMKPVWGLINHHERSSFQIHLLSDSPKGSKWQGYDRDPGDRIHETASLDCDQLSALIRELEIDILVDLNGYSVAERLALFIRSPAPVTVAWFNMYATSGLPGFDYIVGDGEVVNPGEEPFFTEKVFPLPVSYLTFQVDHPTPPVVPPPCLKNGYLTFGSLVTQYKITPPVLDTWANILNRAGGSRLLLANAALKSIHNRQYVLDRFAQRGVDTDRITLCGPADYFTFLSYYDRIDVALDAFPYNGGTTTMEAIWQGIPVLTFDGDRWASRTSQTLLRRTHLKEFVADNVEGMVDLAVNLALSPGAFQRLAEIRRQMRTDLRASSACDTPELARSMERFYASLGGHLNGT